MVFLHIWTFLSAWTSGQNLSQHPSLTKTSLAATTLKPTPLPSVRSSLKPPPPPSAPSPLLRRPAWTWPSPMHIREPPVYKWLPSCPKPGDWPVKQSFLVDNLRSKRRGEKKRLNSFLKWSETTASCASCFTWSTYPSQYPLHLLVIWGKMHANFQCWL